MPDVTSPIFRLAFRIGKELGMGAHRGLAFRLQADAAAGRTIGEFAQNARRTRKATARFTACLAGLLDRPLQRCLNGEVVVSMSLP